MDEAATWKRVDGYIDEIVPFFNILTYYKIGLVVSRVLLNFFYKVSAEHAASPSTVALPRDAIVIYLMNHRSNADYVLVGYVLSGRVAISYAVGEWARDVSARVHLQVVRRVLHPAEVSREAVSHGARAVRAAHHPKRRDAGDLPRGRSQSRRQARQSQDRSARLRARRRARPGVCGSRLYIVPVAMNYDRVLEDRSLLRELDAREGRKRPPRHVAARRSVCATCGGTWRDSSRGGGSVTAARRS